MYKCEFSSWTGVRRGESPNQLMELWIKGDKRTEILKNILQENWEEGGVFQVDDTENIIYDITQMLLLSKYEDEEARYMLELHSDFNLDLRTILKTDYKNIDPEEILDMFCNCIKESWEFNNDQEDLSIEYEISKI
jgi:hypothetical protein